MVFETDALIQHPAHLLYLFLNVTNIIFTIKIEVSGFVKRSIYFFTDTKKKLPVESNFDGVGTLNIIFFPRYVTHMYRVYLTLLHYYYYYIIQLAKQLFITFTRISETNLPSVF